MRGVENHRDRRHAAAFMDLRHDHALICRLDGFHHFHRAKTELREAVRPQSHGQTRRTRRGFHQHIFRARNAAEHLRHFARLVVNHVQVIAKNIHDHRRRFAGDGFADAVAEERHDLGLKTGNGAKNFAQLFHQLRLSFPRHAFLQLHMEFAAVRLPGVLALLRAADLHLGGGDLFFREQFLADDARDPQHLRERSSGHRLRLNDKMAFAKRRQKFSARKRSEPRQCEQTDDHDRADHQSGPARNEGEAALVSGFEPALQAGFVGVVLAVLEK